MTEQTYTFTVQPYSKPQAEVFSATKEEGMKRIAKLRFAPVDSLEWVDITHYRGFPEYHVYCGFTDVATATPTRNFR